MSESSDSDSPAMPPTQQKPLPRMSSPLKPDQRQLQTAPPAQKAAQNPKAAAASASAAAAARSVEAAAAAGAKLSKEARDALVQKLIQVCQGLIVHFVSCHFLPSARRHIPLLVACHMCPLCFSQDKRRREAAAAPPSPPPASRDKQTSRDRQQSPDSLGGDDNQDNRRTNKPQQQQQQHQKQQSSRPSSAPPRTRASSAPRRSAPAPEAASFSFKPKINPYPSQASWFRGQSETSVVIFVKGNWSVPRHSH